VDVSGAKDRPLAVTVVVEAEERVIADGAEVTIRGRALLVAVDRDYLFEYLRRADDFNLGLPHFPIPALVALLRNNSLSRRE
jgi:hypothetical protein